MLNDTRHQAGDPQVTPDETQFRGSGIGMVIAQLLLIGLAGLYLFGVVWLYIQLPWLALIATAVAAGILISGVVSRLRTPPGQ